MLTGLVLLGVVLDSGLRRIATLEGRTARMAEEIRRLREDLLPTIR